MRFKEFLAEAGHVEGPAHRQVIIVRVDRKCIAVNIDLWKNQT